MVEQETLNPSEHEIVTGNGTYIIKVPTGRYAARHFSLMRRAAPKNRDEDGKPVINDDDEDNYQKCFELWAAHVLPGAVVEYPAHIKDYDHMPGEDQYAIWNAMFDLAKVGLEDGSLFLITR
jgi:hypothetical protein